MITLETLPGDKGMKQSRRRVGRGRGSGRGKTSGRGQKGAGSRSGWRERVGYEGGQTPIQRRMPKRGFRNDRFCVKSQIVNVSALERAFDDGQEVDAAALAMAGLIDDPQVRVKVLGAGQLTKRLTIRANAFSSAARQVVEARGGTCETV